MPAEHAARWLGVAGAGKSAKTDYAAEKRDRDGKRTHVPTASSRWPRSRRKLRWNLLTHLRAASRLSDQAARSMIFGRLSDDCCLTSGFSPGNPCRRLDRGRLTPADRTPLVVKIRRKSPEYPPQFQGVLRLAKGNCDRRGGVGDLIRRQAQLAPNRGQVGLPPKKASVLWPLRPRGGTELEQVLRSRKVGGFSRRVSTG
jgi:hypothetical protein